jgi:hypothetical protein
MPNQWRAAIFAVCQGRSLSMFALAKKSPSRARMFFQRGNDGVRDN